MFSSSSHLKEETYKKSGDYEYSIRIPDNFLNHGSYIIQLQSGIPGVRQLLYSIKTLKFSVNKVSDSGSIVENVMQGVTAPRIDWEINKV